MIERTPPPPQNAGAVVELLKVLLEGAGGGRGRRLQADRHRRRPGEDRRQRCDRRLGALKGWRREVFGADALRLKRGELALVLQGSRVKVAELGAG